MKKILSKMRSLDMEAGVDVMITISCHFLPIFGEKIGAFLKNQCYDHNFQPFLPIFGEKIGAILKNQCYDHNFAKSSSSSSKKRQYFRHIFGRKYLKNYNIGP
jgi:hypothetical protein